MKNAALFALVLGILCSCTLAYEIEWNNERALGYYAYDKYRQYPHYIVGVYDADSAPAVASGNRGKHPSVNFHIKVKNPPHNAFQVYIYDIDSVEYGVMKGIPGAHPCMDRGQQYGIAWFKNMTGVAYQESVHGRLSEEIGPDGSKIVVTTLAGEAFLSKTGLYAITINSCRYVNVGDNITDLRRHLDVNNWNDAIITGKVVVKNPYGYLPGELYGCMPAFAVLFIVMLLMTVVYFGMLIYTAKCKTKVGFKGMHLHQYTLLVTLALTTLSYIIYLGYYGAYNNTNKNAMSTFIAAVVFLKLRDTFALIAIWLICYGYRMTIRKLPHHTRVILVVSALCHFTIGCSIYAFDRSIEFASRKNGGKEDSAEEPTMARTAAMVCQLIITGALVLTGVYFLFVNWRVLSAKATVKDELQSGRKYKAQAFSRTFVVVILTLCLSLLWAIIQVRFLSYDGIVGEDTTNWKAWWSITVMPQVILSLALCLLAILWAPLPSSRNLHFTVEEINHSTFDSEQTHRTYTVAERRRDGPAAASETTPAAIDHDGNVNYDVETGGSQEMDAIPPQDSV